MAAARPERPHARALREAARGPHRAEVRVPARSHPSPPTTCAIGTPNSAARPRRYAPTATGCCGPSWEPRCPTARSRSIHASSAAPALARRVHKIRPASLDEIATITQEMPDAYQAMVLLAAWCALRFGELTELRRRDVIVVEPTEDDLSNAAASGVQPPEPYGIVRVERAVVRVDEGFSNHHTQSRRRPPRRRNPAPSSAGDQRPPREVRRTPTKTHCCSRPARAAISHPPACTGNSTKHVPRPNEMTCAGTTYATPARSWPPRPGPRWPS